MRTTFALTLDILDGANRAAVAQNASPPFESIVLEPGALLPETLDAVVVPGMGCVVLDEVDAILESEAEAWVREHITEPIRVDSVASAAGLGASHEPVV